MDEVAEEENRFPTVRSQHEVTLPLTPRDVHITTLQVPVTYEDVLSIVPSLHARPPVLPPSEDEDCPPLPTPPGGYDLIFHVGVAGRGPLRLERLGHKFGYNMKDAKGCHAPSVRVAHDEATRVAIEISEAERMERARLGYVIEPPTESGEPPKRGFGKGYESFPDEIYTDVDVEKLVNYLKKSDVQKVYSSLDAGHYLCDFIYYCSLAESRRHTPKTDKPKTRVLFLHCSVSATERSDLLKQKGVTIWLTGLSASGKSTIACALEQHLLHQRKFTYRLDGDNIRFGLNKDLGFDENSRVENIRRIGEVSKLFADSSCISVTAFISPYRADRQVARELHEKANLGFVEVFIDAPLSVVEQRDPKGLYKKARAGEIKEFTGISAPYEAPENPDIHIRTDECDVTQAVKIITEYLTTHNYI
ncbi:hypothetical protein HYDPIDRAFT_42757 [Hydnomerulius pinastri MD-312]|uniref:Adenylyl-sulfate kinase n=1 Tax=Hydnomerulius pinastri MD-312 TaxID=994086 RepID=A0A0C9V6U9_9AGAM|nr:hypothetical protein HYDPIDRAFT_42757 [Hydnomerulius pinastri MD-312]